MSERSGNRSGGLTKADLVERIYQRHGGLTKSEAGQLVDTILNTVKSELQQGKRIKIKNFGVFEVRDRRGRAGVDPSSGKKIFIPSHRRLSFRPAERLKDLVEDRGKKGSS